MGLTLSHLRVPRKFPSYGVWKLARLLGGSRSRSRGAAMGMYLRSEKSAPVCLLVNERGIFQAAVFSLSLIRMMV